MEFGEFQNNSSLEHHLLSKGVFPKNFLAAYKLEKNTSLFDFLFKNKELSLTLSDERFIKEVFLWLWCLHTSDKIPLVPYIPVPGKRDARFLEGGEERYWEAAWLLEPLHLRKHAHVLLVLSPSPLVAIKNSSSHIESQIAEKFWLEKAARALGHPLDSHYAGCIWGWTSPVQFFRACGHHHENWCSFPCPPQESLTALAYGVDIYYSDSLFCCGWLRTENVNDEKLERIKSQLRALLAKEIICLPSLFPIHESPLPSHELHTPKTSKSLTLMERSGWMAWEEILQEAWNTKASDIHIEPEPASLTAHGSLSVSLRIHGSLHFTKKIPSDCAPSFMECVLESSGILKEDAWRPQDGRKTVQPSHAPYPIDLRISCTPTSSLLPKTVIRILDNQALKKGIEDLHLDPEPLWAWQQALKQESGLIIIAGPTNSGKSTTLYSALISLWKMDSTKSFATVEDPIEYRLPFRSVQTQVQEEKGITYPILLRQTMRNDGDICMVGEIRDSQTAKAAIELALTGHLVLTSLHARSAPATIPRLAQLQADLNVLSEVLLLCASQRLLPLPCPICSQTIPENQAIHLLRAHKAETFILSKKYQWLEFLGEPQWKLSKGCKNCKYSGNSQLIPIQEFFTQDSTIIHAIQTNNPTLISNHMEKKNIHSLYETAWRKAWQGIITIPTAASLSSSLNYKF